MKINPYIITLSLLLLNHIVISILWAQVEGIFTWHLTIISINLLIVIIIFMIFQKNSRINKKEVK